MIIAVHTTPTPTGNSTSTRNKGPSGLKFCMQPHRTQLTTTQHNFNPTIIMVGWVARFMHPPPWFNPFRIFFQQKFFGPKSF